MSSKPIGSPVGRDFVIRVTMESTVKNARYQFPIDSGPEVEQHFIHLAGLAFARVIMNALMKEGVRGDVTPGELKVEVLEGEVLEGE